VLNGGTSTALASLFGSSIITLDVKRYPFYYFCMIRSFSCKHTQALFEGKSPRPFRSIKAAAERKLQLLDSANCLDFLRSPPGNRLEALDGDRAGQHSIRINKNGACALSGVGTDNLTF
jgi:proteic killer suppression protein